ncbi:hypothetical protein DU475_19420 [Rhodopseudomonas sp. WA056]|uniref:hypothetical protein n=1 Tax=Rhodopseudomonas sp. WA056 TaxID=2269367 RepID=UPI0013E0D963|nr:hypothetical protein [Rhodopseudomonas sp. WA056]NEW89418.1 hypothetical protein [Rhodopseudomonas sp. WA056]
MPADHERLQILTLHKSSADRYTVLWQIISFLLVGAVAVVPSYIDVPPHERNGTLGLSPMMSIVAAARQSTDLGITRMHMLLEGFYLYHADGRLWVSRQSW